MSSTTVSKTLDILYEWYAAQYHLVWQNVYSVTQVESESISA